jgi:hypothetical protein
MKRQPYSAQPLSLANDQVLLLIQYTFVTILHAVKKYVYVY